MDPETGDLLPRVVILPLDDRPPTRTDELAAAEGKDDLCRYYSAFHHHPQPILPKSSLSHTLTRS